VKSFSPHLFESKLVLLPGLTNKRWQKCFLTSLKGFAVFFFTFCHDVKMPRPDSQVMKDPMEKEGGSTATAILATHPGLPDTPVSLVHSCCYNKSEPGLNIQTEFFSHTTRGWEVQDQGVIRSAFGEILPCYIDCTFLLHPHMAEATKRSHGRRVNKQAASSLLRAVIPFRKTETSGLNHLLKATPLNIITLVSNPNI
jgi:hypothetical protein